MHSLEKVECDEKINEVNQIENREPNAPQCRKIMKHKEINF